MIRNWFGYLCTLTLNKVNYELIKIQIKSSQVTAQSENLFWEEKRGGRAICP